MSNGAVTNRRAGVQSGKGNYLPKPGPWGVGVSTVRIRVPKEIAGTLAQELSYLLWYLETRRVHSKHTRNWTEFHRLIEHLEQQCPHLMSYTPPDLY